ncbi:DMT family transporter [Ornithobacterium rhinotracheale]|uniref:DMT(Drug/metabolite transporter) superfamily permease n=1 Tax=Ornithobacterium rhinotracheale (strain ATCC 51463 / DSM 15997 / CCUG 23171 / CIP 104009 / LMG 9086) TaxID=867902 RepID=I4A0R1_ORNRL|nr:DMT family transporter [Ornithobacterium rhinotracheale]AFL97545.1 DMT(drug/metabolite transporter) superfamily permease [Ornithobacterium rhinotracheale DSM 15997]AIP98929.1 multidrug transporter [Ornithobacterium rhinotracheale ORT-UMN 88]KGB66872.1 multidrug transporter [Ornithobacterium rhinotracheale H06-030791]MBN3661898.1 DMT family transporter [Ornithobacterium rhinotracheale]MCK0195089.1 DMT family transporter [Ornithobacterium rhinotracheale]
MHKKSFLSQLLSNKWFLLAILSITWGSSFILIKKSLEAFTAIQVGALRGFIAGVFLLPIALRSISKLSWRDIMWVSITGFVGNFLPLFLFPIAQTQVDSSTAGVLDSLIPIFILILNFLIFGQRSKNRQIIGAIIGFIGAGILSFSGESTGSSHFWYAMLIVFACACYAMGSLITENKLAHINAEKISALVYTIWLIPSAIILLCCDFKPLSSTQLYEGLGYVSLLSIVGTAIAYILFYKLLKTSSPIFASTVSYLMPLVAVFWGVLDGEKFNFWHIFSGAMILLSIYLINEKKSNKKALV